MGLSHLQLPYAPKTTSSWFQSAIFSNPLDNINQCRCCTLLVVATFLTIYDNYLPGAVFECCQIRGERDFSSPCFRDQNHTSPPGFKYKLPLRMMALEIIIFLLEKCHIRHHGWNYSNQCFCRIVAVVQRGSSESPEAADQEGRQANLHDKSY